MNVEIRPQRVSDAKRYFAILSSPNFHYLPAKPKTLEEERHSLRLNSEKQNKGTEFNFSIIFNGRHVGAIGIRLDTFRPYIGEIGFFVDEKYWGIGITTEALKKLEKFIIEKTDITRMEIRMAKQNKASQRVAVKGGYKKEGIMAQMLFIEDKCFDCYLYAKIL
ncbi:MAG: GNAT family N-acetyltransferase [Deltaproteobacteria bacterium]|nr:GNAT family N-acetyltransferase [Deltaproteobacteria bacterium]